ncbi:MAG: phosphoenolpyruvate--protein phosphotransferase [Planctomycetaceae bacterium]
MLKRRGKGVSPGVVSGPALVLGTEDFRIPQVFVAVDAVESELERFRFAVNAVCNEIAENEQLANERLGTQYGAIFGAHLVMARDPKLRDEIEQLIRDRNYSPEFAASRVLRHYAREFQNLGDLYLAERAVDVFDLERRILRHLLGERREELASLTTPVIVLAHDLTPSETAKLNAKFVRGFATEVGGPTSHTAILAGALEIPCVVGVGDFLAEVSGGESVILDGTHGEVIIDPDTDTETQFRDSQARIRTVSERLEALPPLPAETKDGTRVHIYGNIEFPDEINHCTQRGADGVGLYRTEFLYLEQDEEPAEQDHYAAYCRVIDAMGDRPVVIRTLDLGADKVPASSPRLARVPNPVLGLRSIRLSLMNTPLFKTQLRAILRAATRGNVSIMFPLVSTLLELRQAKMILADVEEDLEDQGIEFRRNVPVGMMVEVPAAAVLADNFAAEVDFFSVGTNDLIQYTLAADRSDIAVANLYSGADPSVLKLIDLVLRAGEQQEIPVTVCGQMSSDPRFLPVLLGMGLRQISVTPHAIPHLKEVLRNLTLDDSAEILKHARSLDTARDIENYLRGELQKICPDLADM